MLYHSILFGEKDAQYNQLYPEQFKDTGVEIFKDLINIESTFSKKHNLIQNIVQFIYSLIFKKSAFDINFTYRLVHPFYPTHQQFYS